MELAKGVLSKWGCGCVVASEFLLVSWGAESCSWASGLLQAWSQGWLSLCPRGESCSWAQGGDFSLQNTSAGGALDLS